MFGNVALKLGQNVLPSPPPCFQCVLHVQDPCHDYKPLGQTSLRPENLFPFSCTVLILMLIYWAIVIKMFDYYLHQWALDAFSELFYYLCPSNHHLCISVLPGLAHRPRAWWVLKKRRHEDLTVRPLCSFTQETPLNTGAEQLAATTRRRLAMVHTGGAQQYTPAPLLGKRRLTDREGRRGGAWVKNNRRVEVCETDK